MRLRRIEAVRFGQLDDASLGDLGDRLTVVSGPNEAGKTSFMTLVRHVLYGFPTRSDADKDRGYEILGGQREGRLVFDDGSSSWAISRVDGKRGGSCSVHALSGPERPDLVSEICLGVSRLAFNVVFGFGVDELARIESLAGTDDDVISRLYAAGAGLRVSPHDVHATLQADAVDIFTPRGRSKKQMTALLDELKADRTELRTLQAGADFFADDRQRLSLLDGELTTARAQRDAHQNALTRYSNAADRLTDRLERIKSCEDELSELRADLKTAAEHREAAHPDDRVLLVADELDARIGQAVAYGQWRTALRAEQDAMTQAQRELSAIAGQADLEVEALLAIDVNVARTTMCDDARDDLARLQADLESRQRDAANKSAAALRVAADVARACDACELPQGTDAVDRVAERLAALEVLESASSMPPASHTQAPALVLLGSGVVALLAGLSLREYVAVAIGVVLVLAGGFFLLRHRGTAAPVSDNSSALETLGMSAAPTGMSLARKRRLLDACRSAFEVQKRAGQEAEEAESDVEHSLSALSVRQALWAEWLVAQGIESRLTPAQASGLFAYAREAHQAHEIHEGAGERLSRIETSMRDYADGLARTMRNFTDVPEHPEPDEVLMLVSKAKETLGAARTAQTAHDAAVNREVEVTNRVGAAEARLKSAREDATTVLAECDMSEGGSLQAIEQAAQSERAAVQDAHNACDTFSEEHARLDERLTAREHDVRDAELQLEIAGLLERIAACSERYAVLSVAAELVARAQKSYERERQPLVVKQAQRAFCDITAGRYTGLTIPLSGEAVEVSDGHASVKKADHLSRGTAEQMYLALRLGLVASLQDVGPGLPVLMDDVLVDFDPERKLGATRAIAQLSEQRQVVVFTCHPETADLFLQVSPDAVRIDLDRCR